MIRARGKSFSSLCLSRRPLSVSAFPWDKPGRPQSQARKTVACGSLVRVTFLSMLREINSWPRPGEFYESDKSSASAYLPPPGYALMENVFILPFDESRPDASRHFRSAHASSRPTTRLISLSIGSVLKNRWFYRIFKNLFPPLRMKLKFLGYR